MHSCVRSVFDRRRSALAIRSERSLSESRDDIFFNAAIVRRYYLHREYKLHLRASCVIILKHLQFPQNLRGRFCIMDAFYTKYEPELFSNSLEIRRKFTMPTPDRVNYIYIAARNNG